MKSILSNLIYGCFVILGYEGVNYVLKNYIVEAATVQPMREKTATRMTLESDGRWSVPGGLPILRGSEKIYRKGIRQIAGEDYILDSLNPHFIRVRGDILFPYKVVNDVTVVMEVWQKEDVVIMDYLY